MNRILFFIPLLALAGCADDGTPGVPKTPPTAAAAAAMLAADPGEAKSVVDAKIEGPADEVVIEGRIRTITASRFAFTLVDVDLPYCGEECEEGCVTPWDYCCETGKTITANLLNVEVRGEDGKPIRTPALPDLRNLDRVKVKGELTKDEHGNFTLLASGVYRIDRPELPDNLRWPQ